MIIYSVISTYFPVYQTVRLLMTKDSSHSSVHKIIGNAYNSKHPTYYTEYGQFLRNNQLTADDCWSEEIASFTNENDANEYFNDLFDWYLEQGELTLLNTNKRKVIE